MMSTRRFARTSIVILTVALAAAAPAADLTLSWHSIDGGGVMQSTGGNFVLSGTLGQHDPNDPATAMTGADFRLVGGFWAVAVPTCGCLSDINKDDLRDGLDVQGFVECLVAAGSNCACADVDGVPGLDFNDVAVFVADLIDGAACP